jgi:hypothetical protein
LYKKQSQASQWPGVLVPQGKTEVSLYLPQILPGISTNKVMTYFLTLKDENCEWFVL